MVGAKLNPAMFTKPCLAGAIALLPEQGRSQPVVNNAAAVKEYLPKQLCNGNVQPSTLATTSKLPFRGAFIFWGPHIGTRYLLVVRSACISVGNPTASNAAADKCPANR